MTLFVDDPGPQPCGYKLNALSTEPRLLTYMDGDFYDYLSDTEKGVKAYRDGMFVKIQQQNLNYRDKPGVSVILIYVLKKNPVFLPDV
jgi:hypothetical protein